MRCKLHEYILIDFWTFRPNCWWSDWVCGTRASCVACPMSCVHSILRSVDSLSVNKVDLSFCRPVAYRGGWGVKPPPGPKFRSFNKAEPNSQIRGKFICNNLTRIRLSLIFWVVSWKALPASYDPHSGIFFSLQSMTWCKHKVPKIKKILPYEMKFLVPNYSSLQNPWLGGCRP